ncbi:signal recognition particle, SRP19 subunit [Tilletiaria anomala UBC 951]|uniref:Signal recognition particle, SRP19 subunit n=1 Tax=Tilletiaria anomala (strain ATCC 24038 / CBS 436.72 / UBC 951) TaxID=1037660 RepID=A0A066VXE7_TILAU|nr:signal recognition particle, SRP19 subunit [Tilletiaria anomala UBC 951]KDN43220.1 signal recognition particle, SRP19 subunit [Tilletiaria anomala UBC 951]
MPPNVASASVADFDDDTDFALPEPPPQARGGPDQMAALQQMMGQLGAGDAGVPGGGMGASGSKATGAIDDLNAEHKEWIAIYPIYLDAKRPFGKGCRRVSYTKSSLFPQSLHIAKALSRLNISAVHEVRKTHPKDWENPGRVKAKLFNEDWLSLHPTIKTKKQLIEAIAEIVQPWAGGPPPPLPDLKVKAEKLRMRREAKATASAAASVAPAGKKTSAGTAAQPSKKATDGTTAASPSRRSRKIAPPAVNPIKARLQQIRFPPLEDRLPPHSPAIEQGILNMDLAGAMGGGMPPGLEGMNPIASMLGGFMGGDDDEDEEAKEVQKKDEKPMPGLSRRQRKKVVRIGR